MSLAGYIGSEERDLVTRDLGHSKQSRIGSQTLQSMEALLGKREKRNGKHRNCGVANKNKRNQTRSEKRRTFLIMDETFSILQKGPDTPKSALAQSILMFILVHRRKLRQIDTFP
jgi:hypothetical protein